MVDVYQAVTDRILAEMQKGIIPWNRPWTGCGSCVNYVTRKPYSLLNEFLLGEPGEYLTFNQVKALGGKVKKGAKARMVFFYKWYEKAVDGNYTEVNESGARRLSYTVYDLEDNQEPETKRYPVPRSYSVFHLKDTEGIESKFTDDRVPALVLTPDQYAERIVNKYWHSDGHIRIFRDEPSNRAYYSIGQDSVVVPCLAQYADLAEYYSTIFHELTHSTGVSFRCKRGIEHDGSYGSDKYSVEELVAEFGAAMLLSASRLEHTDAAMHNSAAYIKSWSRRFSQDKKLLITAASKAEKAVQYILGCKPCEFNPVTEYYPLPE